MNTMQGAIIIGGKREVELREFPVPEPGPGQVVLRMQAAGMCGSDLHNIYRTMNLDDPHQVEDFMERQLEKLHDEAMKPAKAMGNMADGLPALGIVACCAPGSCFFTRLAGMRSIFMGRSVSR